MYGMAPVTITPFHLPLTFSLYCVPHSYLFVSRLITHHLLTPHHESNGSLFLDVIMNETYPHPFITCYECRMVIRALIGTLRL